MKSGIWKQYQDIKRILRNLIEQYFEGFVNSDVERMLKASYGFRGVLGQDEAEDIITAIQRIAVMNWPDDAEEALKHSRQVAHDLADDFIEYIGPSKDRPKIPSNQSTSRAYVYK